jgi:hypothetical protein
VAGFLVYVRFTFGLSPLEKYYLPYYLRTDTAGMMHQNSEYQLIYVLNDARDTRLALDSDVQTGQSPQVVGKALPFQLSLAGVAPFVPKQSASSLSRSLDL